MFTDKSSPGSTKTFVGIIHEEQYFPQAADAFKRFEKKLGQTISFKGNRPHKVWTNFKVYTQLPTLQHPLTIKIGLHNKKGRAFCQLKLSQFDELLDQLMSWRIEHTDDLNNLTIMDKILNFRREIIEETSASLSAFNTPISDLNITEKFTQEPEDSLKLKIYKKIDQFQDRVKNGKLYKKSDTEYFINEIIKDCNKLIDPTDILSYLQNFISTELKETLENV